MVKFNDEHKADTSNNYFDEGIHQVKIVDVIFDTDNQDREYAEFLVKGANGEEGTARMWFTTDKAINFAFNIIKGIFVHNSPEGQKDKMRATIDAIADTDELAKACKQLKGKEAWYQVVQSGTYEKDGETKKSYNRNIFGYEPKPKASTGTPASDNTQPIKTTDADGQEQLIADF